MAELDRVAAMGKRAKPAKVARVHACPARGLCKVCGWEGKRVPVAWLDEPPGAPYEGQSKLLGQRVRLRGDTVDSVVVGLATPLGGSLLQGARSKRYRCQGSYVVRTPFGAGSIETPVPKSVVRERRRTREGNCPDAAVYSSLEKRLGVVRELERDAARQRRHPFDLVNELPYPHRKGASACCVNSPVHPDKLQELLNDWDESGEPREFERARRAVRRALPRDLRATMELETRDHLAGGIEAVKDHCWGQWLSSEARAKETRKQYRARRKEAAELRAAQGLDTGRRLFRERRSDVAASEGQSAALALALESFGEWQPEALPVDFDVEVFE